MDQLAPRNHPLKQAPVGWARSRVVRGADTLRPGLMHLGLSGDDSRLFGKVLRSINKARPTLFLFLRNTRLFYFFATRVF
ncbi:MAG: hypothetical protein KatS3mg112_1343 [Thermogutta sp.]|nr:MAG: hypothetical protein KatS3mg112_1343 [Thermogutta sp.]